MSKAIPRQFIKKADCERLVEMATHIHTKEGNHYVFMPHYLKEIDSETYEIYLLGNLPEDLTQFIKEHRNEIERL